MNKENILLILWIVFGFVFINAIDSIINFTIYLIFFIKSELEISYKIMQFSMPIITLIIYSLTTFFLIKKLKLNSNSSGIYLTEFPKRTFFILALLSFTLSPIINKLFGLYSEHSTFNENYNLSDFLEVYSSITSGIFLSRLLVLTMLIIVFINKLDRYKKSNTPNQ